MNHITRISETEIEVDGKRYELKWEPKEKEWEIMSYSNGELIAKREENGLFGTHVHIQSEQTWINGGYKIHSVKRLSDGTIFTVGDTIEHVTQKYTTKINDFTIPNSDPNGMWFYWDDRGSVRDMKNFTTHKPLTISDIYRSNDSRWCIGASNNISEYSQKNTGNDCYKSQLPTELDCKRVQAWIKMRNIMWYFQKDWEPKTGDEFYVLKKAGVNSFAEKWEADEGFIYSLQPSFKERHHAEEAIRLMGDDLQYLM